MRDEEIPKYRAKKDTKRWCKGRVGVGHEPSWIKDVRHADWLIYACSKCGKHFNLYCPFFDDKYVRPKVGSTEPLQLANEEEEE